MRFLCSLWTAVAATCSFSMQAQVITAVPCEDMGLVVNVGSNPNSISLYHPGGYLTWPQTSNVMDWEFTDSAGNVLHETLLVDENFVSFSFDIPLTDTMYVSVLLTNDSASLDGNPVACLIEDYLFWEINTWPNSGEEYGTWTLGGSIGENVFEPVECIDETLIDPEAFCPEIFDPVCGCDGVTYSNSCQATVVGGVTSWEPGGCIVIEYGGCTYPLACNYDPGAGFEDGSCTFPPEGCSWTPAWSYGCTYEFAINFDPNATVDDGSCTVEFCPTCPGDLNGDGSVSTSDLLDFLTMFGQVC